MRRVGRRCQIVVILSRRLLLRLTLLRHAGEQRMDVVRQVEQRRLGSRSQCLHVRRRGGQRRPALGWRHRDAVRRRHLFEAHAAVRVVDQTHPGRFETIFVSRWATHQAVTRTSEARLVVSFLLLLDARFSPDDSSVTPFRTARTRLRPFLAAFVTFASTKSTSQYIRVVKKLCVTRRA